MNLRVLSLNLHKGFDSMGRRFVLREIRDALREARPNFVCLQELQGFHADRAVVRARAG